MSRTSQGYCAGQGPLVSAGRAASLVPFLTVAFWGCTLEDVASTAIATHGIHSRVVVQSPGDGSTQIQARLAVGGLNGTRVVLVQGDQIDYEVGDDSFSGSLTQTSAGRLSADFSSDAAARVTVTFNRADFVSAGSSVDMPEPYSMSWPEGFPDTPTIDRSQSVQVTWSPPAEGLIEWEVSGDCIWSESGVEPDDGQFTLPPEAFRVRSLKVGEPCEVMVRLDRRASGTTSDVFVPGSSIEALQSRALRFRSEPSEDELGVEPEDEEPEEDSAPEPEAASQAESDADDDAEPADAG